MNPKFHPILFQPEMVQANLAGRKTMTRRTTGLNKINQNPDGYYFQSLVLHATGRYTFAPQGNYNPSVSDIIEVKCPYGKPGDYLWVRETWQHSNHPLRQFLYKASVEKESSLCIKYKASIHMPKEAARIILQVEDTRIERLQDITEADCVKEGIKREIFPPTGQLCYYFYPCNDLRDDTFLDYPKTSFYSLWKSIHGQQSWDINPWLWVIAYKVISTAGCPEELKPLLFQTAKKSKK